MQYLVAFWFFAYWVYHPKEGAIIFFGFILFGLAILGIYHLLLMLFELSCGVIGALSLGIISAIKNGFFSLFGKVFPNFSNKRNQEYAYSSNSNSSDYHNNDEEDNDNDQDFYNENSSSNQESNRADYSNTSYAKEEEKFDPYEILGVGRGASKEEIKSAFRNQMKLYHPDRVSQLGPLLQVAAKKRSQEITQAYEWLG